MKTDLNYQVCVIEDYQAPYPDPIQARAGEEVVLDMDKKTDITGWVWCTNRAGKSGWVPKSYIELQGHTSKMLYDYSALELTIHVGEILTVHKVESGFCWATDRAGRQGWVPAANVERITSGH